MEHDHHHHDGELCDLFDEKGRFMARKNNYDTEDYLKDFEEKQEFLQKQEERRLEEEEKKRRRR